MGKQSYGRRDSKENVTVVIRNDQGEIGLSMYEWDRPKYAQNVELTKEIADEKICDELNTRQLSDNIELLLLQKSVGPR